MKLQQLIAYRGASILSDYIYELTPRGAERARSHAAQSTYFGAVPVTLQEYVASVEAQSLQQQKPRLGDIKRCLSDLVLDEDLLRQIGEAANLGKGLFLYGTPGNGKTSIAHRLTSVYGEGIWIPRAIHSAGNIVRIFDPIQHEVLEQPKKGPLEDAGIDQRWVYIRRPTIVVGGELELKHLDVGTNKATNICEAPIQVKANCGTLVIDDLGRQKFDIDALLNRLIVPLERRQDSLTLPHGRSFNVPFDLMIVFSTNLQPESLVDEAFLRRVPYTIHTKNPTVEQFREVFDQAAKSYKLTYESSVLDYLIRKYYEEPNRPMRFSHADDILCLVANACEFQRAEMVVTEERIDAAIVNCLAIQHTAHTE